MPRPMWFEIPADDVKRAVAFYETVFGWEFSGFPDWPDYFLTKGWRAPHCAVGGAIMSRAMGPCTRNAIDVPSLDEYSGRVEQAGGQQIGPRVAIPEGVFAVFEDPEGNQFGMLEPERGKGPQPVEPGPPPMLAVVHFDIPARDVARAVAFYQAVFGWNIFKWDGPMDYWIVDTGPATQPGMHGGLSERPAGECVMNTVRVPDLAEYTQKVREAGGQVRAERNEIPGVGWIAWCADTEGNPFGMLQPL